MKQFLIFVVICVLIIGAIVNSCKEGKNKEPEKTVIEQVETNTAQKAAESYMIGTWKHKGTYSGTNKTGKWLNMNAASYIEVAEVGSLIYHNKDTAISFKWEAGKDGTITFYNQKIDGSSYSFTIDDNCIVLIYQSGIIGTICSYYTK